jgi:hypothetical protein
MTRTRTLGTLLLGVATTAALTGCGSSDGGGDFADQSAEKIESQVKADMKSASSLTMSGSVTDDDGETAIDLAVDTEGSCVGTLGRDGAEAQVLSVDGASYLKADEEFWGSQGGAQASQLTALLGDKWAKLPSGDGEFAEFCDLDNFLEQFFEESDDDDPKMTKGDVTEVDGQDALELVSTEDDTTTTAWVAVDGKHYILKIEREGDDSGSFTFTDFNEEVDAEVPAEDEVVDLAALGG